MTANEVIDAVRKRLGDSVTERWDDETLLLYVSLCQNDICIFTRFYRKTVTIPLIDNQFEYDLPTDCLAVTRFEYNCQLMPMESRNTIDSARAGEGEVKFPCVLKDNVPFGEIEIVIDSYRGCDVSGGSTLYGPLEATYGVVTASDSDATEIDCALDDDYGVVTDVSPDSSGSSSSTPVYDLLVYYSAVPPLIASDGGDLQLLVPDIWFQAFIHFVSGMALQDDNDANNIQRGELEAQKYVRMLDRLQKVAAKDFTTNIPSKLTTSMRRV